MEFSNPDDGWTVTHQGWIGLCPIYFDAEDENVPIVPRFGPYWLLDILGLWPDRARIFIGSFFYPEIADLGWAITDVKPLAVPKRIKAA